MSKLRKSDVSRVVPARLELVPGLARAPKVQPLLDMAYSIAHDELRCLQFQSQMGRLDDGDFKRFAVIMERLPAMLREERGGDKDAADTLARLPPGEVKRLAAEWVKEQERGEAEEERVDPEEPSGDEPEAPGEGEQG